MNQIYLTELMLVHPSDGNDLLVVRLLHGGHLLLERVVHELELLNPVDVLGESVIEVTERLLLLGPGDLGGGQRGGGPGLDTRGGASPRTGAGASAGHFDVNLDQRWLSQTLI